MNRPASANSHVSTNYQSLLVAISEMLDKRLAMRERQLVAILNARRDAVAFRISTESEVEKLEAKRMASLNKQIASLGAALSDIATAAQQDHEAGK